MTKNVVYFGIIILAITAAVLGYKIYQQRSTNQPILKNQSPSPVKKTPDGVQSNQQAQKQPTSQKISKAELAELLNFPGPNATEEQRKKHSDLVNKWGNQSGVPSLNISGCNPDPVVYRVKNGGTLNVTNSDQVEHNFYTQPSRKVVVPANSDKVIESTSIGDNFGDYGYNCDGSTSPVGIIQVVP